ncbi:MAG: hypothetical protein MJH10_19580 [Epibacterium sp.]|nr:hypothetical protein [Epibacterium sp.]NQX75686.1 hypothetical protein [Epibacterium sp.]
MPNRLKKGERRRLRALCKEVDHRGKGMATHEVQEALRAEGIYATLNEIEHEQLTRFARRHDLIYGNKGHPNKRKEQDDA